jgi:hypothetical protein
MLQIIAVITLGFAGFHPAAGADAPAVSTL